MIDFKIPSMSCGHCVGVITKAVKANDPQAEVRIDLPNHMVHVETTRGREETAKVLANAGYASL